MVHANHRRALLITLMAAALGALGCEDTRAQPANRAGRGSPLEKSVPRVRTGGMDVTFLVTADTHFGVGVEDKDPSSARPVEDAQGIEKAQLKAVRAMNAIEGKPFPPRVGLSVGRPRGVLAGGDLTEDGHPAEWARFVAYFGHDGTDGLLRFPVFETWGNHDKNHGWYVRKRIEERHGHIRYTIDWQDLHVICLGEAPDYEDLRWLGDNLRRVGREVGIILYMHYPLSGPFSDGNWFGDGDYREKLASALAGYRVLGIFHGHYHASLRYQWRGYDVYNVGSPKHGYHSFAAVRVTDERMVVGSWDYRQERWGWVHDKPVVWTGSDR